MKNIFNSVLFPAVKKNRFNLSHDIKLSFSMGELVPTCVMDVIPGDEVTISVENMLRFAPLISPVMHKVNVTTHYFFVPNRILWDEWEKWIVGESELPAPYVPLDATVGVGSLADYLGIPTGTYEEQVNASAFPFAAYLKIWDEYYRDQNLQTEKFQPLIPGNNGASLATYLTAAPLHRAWMHDYLTSALPFAQKGDAVQIPLVTSDTVEVEHLLGPQPLVRVTGDGSLLTNVTLDTGAAGEFQGNNTDATLDPNGSLVVDVQADATDINTLRRAFRLQEWLERNARGGTRYVENILAHFGVKSSDARLQRPEYIGGSKQNMVISEVLATAQSNNDGSTAEVAVGTMAGHGISVGGGNTFRYRAEEHGYIIGLINVQPVTAYQDGLHRSWSRFDRLDYAWPSFANIGEQEVLQKEVRARVEATTDPNRVFGYVPRYAEYKFMNSRVAGEMRTSLAFWHLGRIFTQTTDPELNENFITCQPSTRIFAVTSSESDHIYAHIFNNIKAVRKLPRYGIPTI